MQIISAVNEIYQQGKNILNAKQLNMEINEIKKSIYQTYFNLSSSHFTSCQVSLEAAKLSSDPEIEVRAAIHHLYDAFFILYDLLEKKVEKKNIIGIKYNDDVVKYKEDIYVPCCKISALVYGLYYFLDEKDNAKVWHEYMLQTFSNAKHALNFGDKKHEVDSDIYNNLKRISDKYVKWRLGYEWATSVGSRYDPRGGVVIRYFITDAGCEYAKKVIKDLDNRVNNSIYNNCFYKKN